MGSQTQDDGYTAKWGTEWTAPTQQLRPWKMTLSTGLKLTFANVHNIRSIPTSPSSPAGLCPLKKHLECLLFLIPDQGCPDSTWAYSNTRMGLDLVECPFG